MDGQWADFIKATRGVDLKMARNYLCS